jgi:ParB family transcriptional regulator, chromosome partitioning protein
MATKLEERISNAASGKSGLKFHPLGEDEPRLSNIRIEDIERDPNQPRTVFGDLDELKASVKEHGIIQPLVVSPLDETRYRIIAGERRFTVAEELKFRTVPALIRTVEEQKRLELQIVENLHRTDLNPIDEAKGYKRLMDEFNLTQREVGKRIGKSKASINEILRILDLSDDVVEQVRTSELLSKSLLLEIVKHPEKDIQLELIEKAKTGKLTVREARNKKQRRKKEPKSKIVSKRFKATKGQVILKMKNDFSSIDDMKDTLKEVLEQLGEQATD